MKTYQDYYNDWQLSVESRDLAFDEWLMLLLDRKEREMTDKAKEWIANTFPSSVFNIAKMQVDFVKFMEEEK